MVECQFGYGFSLASPFGLALSFRVLREWRTRCPQAECVRMWSWVFLSYFVHVVAATTQASMPPLFCLTQCQATLSRNFWEITVQIFINFVMWSLQETFGAVQSSLV